MRTPVFTEPRTQRSGVSGRSNRLLRCAACAAQRVLCLVLSLAAAAPLRADDRAAALALVEEAIKAHGGADALAKTQTVVRKLAGRMTVSDKEILFADESTAQLPERWRVEADLRAGDQKLHTLLVVNGDKGWQSTGGAVTELTAERLKELREDGYARWLTTLLPLRKDPAFELTPLPEAKVNDEPALGVKVSRKGHADVSLYFDKKSRLLVKLARQVEQAGHSSAGETVYSGYKEFDGVKLPTKIVQTRDGKKLVEITEAGYKFPAKVEDTTFAKP
jgi:hypothetical protein